jgi:hypothetical protein
LDEKPDLMSELLWPVEEIPDGDNIFRQIHYTQWDKQNKDRKVPKDSHFVPDPDGLSVNWEQYCSLKDVFIIIGLSHKFPPNPEGKFKDPTGFLVIKFNVKGLRKIEGINEVKHNPIFYGVPPPIGKPNNRGHSLVIYPNDEQIRLLLCEAVHNNQDCVCKIDFKIIEAELQELKRRLG